MKLNISMVNNQGGYKMRFLRNILVIIFALSANNEIQAQSNPGFMGKTGLVQFDLTGLMGNLIYEGPAVKVNYGFSYEKARNQNFAWNFGYSQTNQTMDYNMIIGEYLTYYDNGQYNNVRDKASFDYSFSEFKITPKWYNASQGAVSPYGVYSGLELSLGFLNISNADKEQWRQPLSSEEGAKLNSIPSVTVFSASYIFGGRRMVTDQIGVDFTLGMGYTLYQTLPGNLLDYVEGDSYAETIQEFYQYTALKHMSCSKLFQAKLGVSYLF
jgi:hypothetical protein